MNYPEDIYVPCRDRKEIEDFYQRNPSEEHVIILPACSTVYRSGDRVGMASEQGSSIFCGDEYVCDAHTMKLAQEIADLLRQDPDLITVFQVHES